MLGGQRGPFIFIFPNRFRFFAFVAAHLHLLAGPLWREVEVGQRVELVAERVEEQRSFPLLLFLVVVLQPQRRL